MNGTGPKDVLHVPLESEDLYIGRQVYQVRLDLCMGVAGEPKFVGENAIDHTPQGSELAVKIGDAFDVTVQPTLVSDVKVNSHRDRYAVSYLVRNAREAMASGGRLHVTVDAPEAASGAVGQVRLRLSDSGEGIPEADRAKIFDPFFSTKDKGTGLGLALVQQIVAEHGGRIDVESEVGRGTTVALTFPVAKRVEEAPSPMPSAPTDDETAAAMKKALA